MIALLLLGCAPVAGFDSNGERVQPPAARFVLVQSDIVPADSYRHGGAVFVVRDNGALGQVCTALYQSANGGVASIGSVPCERARP